MKQIQLFLFNILLTLYFVTSINATEISQWTSLGPDITEIHHFAQDTTNNILYLVTGDNTEQYENPSTRKIIRSTNGGQDWEEISRVHTRHIYDIQVNPYNPSILYINGYSQAFFLSEDMGMTWHI